MNYLKILLSRKIHPKDVWHYFVGNYRYALYYSKHFRWLLRWHIKEQIAFRLQYIREECYEQGSCVECGCQIPHLQMAKKSCEGLCYPELMNSRNWSRFRVDSAVRQNKCAWFLNSATKILTLIQDNVSERKPKLR